MRALHGWCLVSSLLLLACGGQGKASSGATTTTTTTSTGGTGTGGGSGGTAGGTGTGGTAPGPVDHEVFGSGTRLRAEYVDAGSGAVDFIQFRDTTLGVPCSFATHADGTIRCIPPSAVNFGLFSDAACTMALAESNTGNCQQPPAYVITNLPGTKQCVATDGNFATTRTPYTNRVYALGAEVKPTEVYQSDGMGGCTKVTVDGPSFHYWQIGAEVPSSTFVKATEVDELRGARAKVKKQVGEDGSYVVTSVSDAQLGFECGPGLAGSPCLPRFEAQVDLQFADGACTKPVATRRIDPSGCAPPAVLYQYVPGTNCAPATYNFFAVGAAVPGASVYDEQSATKCVLYSTVQSNLSTYEFYTPGAPIPAGTYFPTAPADRGKGRVIARRRGLSTGELIAESASFYDTQMSGQECVPIQFQSGKKRCVPGPVVGTSNLSIYFSDAACTQRIVQASKGPCPPDDQYPTQLAIPTGTGPTCIGTTGNQTIAEIRTAVPYTGPVYIKGATCTSTINTGGMFSPGAAVDEASFPEVQVNAD